MILFDSCYLSQPYSPFLQPRTILHIIDQNISVSQFRKRITQIHQLLVIRKSITELTPSLPQVLPTIERHEFAVAAC